MIYSIVNHLALLIVKVEKEMLLGELGSLILNGFPSAKDDTILGGEMRITIYQITFEEISQLHQLLVI